MPVFNIHDLAFALSWYHKYKNDDRLIQMRN